MQTWITIPYSSKMFDTHTAVFNSREAIDGPNGPPLFPSLWRRKNCDVKEHVGLPGFLFDDVFGHPTLYKPLSESQKFVQRIDQLNALRIRGTAVQVCCNSLIWGSTTIQSQFPCAGQARMCHVSSTRVEHTIVQPCMCEHRLGATMSAELKADYVVALTSILVACPEGLWSMLVNAGKTFGNNELQ